MKRKPLQGDHDYGRALRIMRASLDMPQITLAKKGKLGSAMVSAIERGHRKPSLDALERMAKAMRVPLYLLVLLASPENEGHLSPDAARELAHQLRRSR